jgi:hypothetical protein
MSESSHYYDGNGKPCHTQKTKAGAKHKTRATRVTDAIRLGLFPSVTGITSVLANYNLQRARERKIIEACFDVAPGAHEGLEEYGDFIMERAFSSWQEASDLGSNVHGILEKAAMGKHYDKDELLLFPLSGQHVKAGDVVEPVLAKMAEAGMQPKGCEVVLVNHKEGYAGTCDLPWIASDLTRLGVADYKVTKTEPGEPVNPREGYVMQLAAYIDTYWGGITDNSWGVNFAISSTEPGRVDAIWHDPATLRAAYEAFLHCAAIWRFRNKYDPRQKAKEAA